MTVLVHRVKGEAAGVTVETDLAIGAGRAATHVRVAAVDASAVVVATLLVDLLRGPTDPAWPAALTLAAVTAGWLLNLTLHDLYDVSSYRDRRTAARRLISSGMHAVVLLAVVSYVAGSDLALTLAAVVVPAVTAATLVGRLLARRWLLDQARAGQLGRRVVVLGDQARALDLVARLRSETTHDITVVGVCLPTSGQVPELLDGGIPVMGGFENIARAAEICRADTVVIAGGQECWGLELRRLLWRLHDGHLEVAVWPGLEQIAPSRMAVQHAGSVQLLTVAPPELRPGERAVRAVLDRSIALVALIVLSPLLLGIAALVRLTSHGPALFLQQRVGHHERLFRMVKFRTMTEDADSGRADLREQLGLDGATFKMREDPRITSVGRVLRRLSLDELPQLWNVLMGDMSLVGPRPHPVDDVARYTADARRRLLVKPGLTGLWQVSGRSDLSWDESLTLDLRYVETRTLGLDVSLLLRTGRAVVKGTGAY